MRLNRGRAAELLPKCGTLEDAERLIGKTFAVGDTMTDSRAETWGVFDGYRGRPSVPPKNHEAVYNAAYAMGTDISLRELPG